MTGQKIYSYMDSIHKLPIVTIVTPSYNQGRYIRDTIESVLSQNYPRIEYIIVDNKSNDNTLDIVREYGDRFTFVCEKDHGQSDAINKGFRMAKGEIVAWLNSDDIYEPGCIQRAVLEFQNHPGLGLVYGDGYIIDEKGKKIKSFQAVQEFCRWDLINVQDYILQPAAFIRKSCLEEAGYLDTSLHWCMDWDLWIRLSKITHVKYVSEYFACSREYSGTKTSTGGRKRLLEIKKLMQKYSGRRWPLGYGLYWAGEIYQRHPENKAVHLLVWMINQSLLKVIRRKRCSGRNRDDIV